MKNFILTALLICSTTTVTFGQTKENIAQKQLELKRKQEKQINRNQSLAESKFIPINQQKVITGSKEYNLLKAEGKLAHYEVIQKEGKTVAVVKTTYSKNSSPLTSTLTPCDIVPIGTTAPFAAPLDDETYFNETGTYINLPFNFCFYGNSYNQVNYSSNGNIQFPPTNNTAFSSVGFPAPNDKMIAPFWSDLDNRGIGSYFFDVFATYAVFTWQNVGYYSSHSDKTNTFQMVITDGLDPVLPSGKNVGFYYGSMQWTTGDASSGLNGFPNPAITPAIPATVGANAGNGVDYFLIGRFGQPGAFYDGPLGADDGVSWLDGKSFFFNACPPTGANNEPIPTLIGYCDTMKVCGNDTLYVKNTFIAPEVSQSVTVTATAPTLGSAFSYSVLPNTNSTDIYMIIDGGAAPAGYHTITMSATDNGTPPLTSSQNFVVYVDQGALNNLNGTIVVTPTLGACPGGVVTTSVTVNGGVPDSYLWNNNSTSATTSYTTIVPADSLIFVTLTSGQCQKTITGHININPVPTANISGNLSYCNGDASSTVLTATNTTNPGTQGPHNYLWASGTNTLSSDSAVAVGGGVYTVTVTNQFGCISVASTTVTINESPSYSISTNAVASGSVYCANQDTARISIDYLSSSSPACGLASSGCVVSNIVQVGTGTTTTSNGAETPYDGTWESAIHQYLIKASELTTAGVQAGKLSSLAFNITNLNGGSLVYENFRIKMKCTTDNVLTTTMDQTGLIDVFPSATVSVTTGWNTYSFPQPYVWDGTSNILVSVCFWNPNWDGTNTVEYTNVGYDAVRYADQDIIDMCPEATAEGTNQNRPNMRFGNCLSQQSASQFDVTVTPTVGVVIPSTKDSIKIDLPTTPGITCYTVTVTNPVGNCVKDTVICVNTNVGLTTATFTVNTDTVCIGSPVILTANGAQTYTISYIQGGTPVQLTTNATYTHVPVQAGLNIYTLTAVGACGAAPVGYTVGVIVNPLANLTMTSLQDVTKCLNTPFTITTGVGSTTPGFPGTPYTYSWTTLPGNLPAPGVSNTSSYTANSNSTQTLVVNVSGSCATTTKDTIVVQNFNDNLSISIIDSASICATSPFSLSSSVSGGRPSYNYSWYLVPSGVIATSSSLTYTSPDAEGVYMITVSVTDSCGYSDSDNQLINVLPPCTVEIPNIVTANGDGINDIFKIKNIEFHSNTSLTIYDRWGRKVYDNQNYNNEWKAEGVSAGTYFYVIDVPDDKKYNGFITIFNGN